MRVALRVSVRQGNFVPFENIRATDSIFILAYWLLALLCAEIKVVRGHLCKGLGGRSAVLEQVRLLLPGYFIAVGWECCPESGDFGGCILLFRKRRHCVLFRLIVTLTTVGQSLKVTDKRMHIEGAERMRRVLIRTPHQSVGTPLGGPLDMSINDVQASPNAATGKILRLGQVRILFPGELVFVYFVERQFDQGQGLVGTELRLGNVIRDVEDRCSGILSVRDEFDVHVASKDGHDSSVVVVASSVQTLQLNNSVFKASHHNNGARVVESTILRAVLSAYPSHLALVRVAGLS